MKPPKRVSPPSNDGSSLHSKPFRPPIQRNVSPIWAGELQRSKTNRQGCQERQGKTKCVGTADERRPTQSKNYLRSFASIGGSQTPNLFFRRARRGSILPRISLANLGVLGGSYLPLPPFSFPSQLTVAKSLTCSILQHYKRTGEPGMPFEVLPRLACCGVRSVFQRGPTGRGVNRRKLLPLNRLRTSSHASFRRPLAKLFSVSAPVNRVPARLTAACSGGFGNHSYATTVPKKAPPLLGWSVTKSGMVSKCCWPGSV